MSDSGRQIGSCYKHGHHSKESCPECKNEKISRAETEALGELAEKQARRVYELEAENARLRDDLESIFAIATHLKLCKTRHAAAVVGGITRWHDEFAMLTTEPPAWLEAAIEEIERQPHKIHPRMAAEILRRHAKGS